MTAPVATPDLLTRAMQTLRQSGFTDDQIMQMPRNPTMGIAALRRAGWNDNDLLLLGQMVPPQNPPPDPMAQLQRLLGIVLQARPDATKQKKREPERITAQWRPAEMRSAQPGQVPVTNQMVRQQQIGQVKQWAQEQANDPRVMAGMVADVLPGIGDIKAGLDAVGLFRSGHPLAGALALASILPAVPGPIKDMSEFKVDFPGWKWALENPNKITAWTPKPVQLDPRDLVSIPGARGEHARIDPETIARLTASMRERGFDAGSAPLIVVERGKGPLIYEGNHRIRAAIEAGIESIPVEVKYSGGAEQFDDVWKPRIVKKGT